MTTSEHLSERDEIEMLLPWFITGQLDAVDKAKVEAYLAKEPAMRQQLDLIREEQAVTIADNEAVPVPRGVSVASGMDYVAANSPALQAKQAGAGLMQQVRAFFAAPTARGVRYAAIAAAAVFALQAAAIGSLWTERTAPELASGKENRIVVTGTFALVTFKDGVALSAASDMLRQFGMAIVDGPTASGVFTVRLSTDALNAAQRSGKLTQLRQRSDVVQLAIPKATP